MGRNKLLQCRTRPRPLQQPHRVHRRCLLQENGQSAEDYVREMLGIPYGMEVLSIITLGHKNEEKKPFDPDKAQWEKVHIEHW